MRAATGSLRRILALGDGLAVVVGAVIGVGILRTPGLIAGYLGNAPLILLVWVVGGAIALASSMVFAEMAAMYPDAGGKFAYAHVAFGPVAGFVVGWSEILVTRGFSAASKAIVIGEYLILLTGWGAIRPWAAAVVAAFFAINVLGLRVGRVFQNVVTILKVCLIVVIIVAGLVGGAAASESTDVAVAGNEGILFGIALAYLAISFTYYGWDDLLKMAGEVRDPGKTLPRILGLGAVSVALLYLAINVAFLSALTPAEMAGSTLVAADAVAVTFGVGGHRFITVAALIILVSSLNVQFLSLPRVAYGLADKGLAPPRLLGVSRGGTPLGGLLIVTALVFVMAMTRSFELLIQFLAFVAITVDSMVLLALFRLRRVRPSQPRPFRVPAYPWWPALTVGAYLAIFGVIVGTQPRLAFGGAAIVGVLVLAGLGWVRWGRPKTPRPA